jgi:glutamine amidotransferase
MITIVDYGMGNLHSVKRKLQKLGANVSISSNPEEIVNATKLILPGVGHFGKAMEKMNATGIRNALDQAVIERRAPVLGICLGMQLMAKTSEEGLEQGLGWFDAEVVRLEVKDSLRFKIPHTGWNTVVFKKEDSLFKGLGQNPEFYFVHAYHFKTSDPRDILTNTMYENTFVSSVSRDHIYGVQFHPEKSHDTGIMLLENFIRL